MFSLLSFFCLVGLFVCNYFAENINPRPPEVFFCNTSSEGGLLQPSPDFLNGTLDTPIFATSV